MKQRLIIILFFVVIFVSFIAIWNESYQQSQQGAEIAHKPLQIAHLTSEVATFRRANFALDYANMPIDKSHQRLLKFYYNNRAYPGAPPYIPHPIDKDDTIGGNACLQCHRNGGFVAKFDAYAPVTPHPNIINCRQCHVEKTTHNLFKQTNFVAASPPKVGKGINNFLEGSPPQIPHQMQLRANCLACHAGPSAPKEIRVSHPERINCRQCHVPKNQDNVETVFSRN